MIELIRHKAMFSKFMLRILKYFLIIIIFMFVIIVTSMRFLQVYNQNNSKLVNDVTLCQSLIDAMNSSSDNIRNYYIGSKQQYYDAFKSNRDYVMQIALQLREKHPSNYHFRDMHEMLKTFYTDADQIFSTMMQDNTKIYVHNDILRLESLARYIADEGHKSMGKQLSEIQKISMATSNKIRRANFYIYILICFITLLCIGVAYRFSKQLSSPIVSLANQLKRVASGDLTVREPEIQHNDEINLLIVSFNHMVQKLQMSIEEIKQKSMLETMLHNEKLKNIQMNNLLQQSELKFLQMQINPHFLFNTLNSVSAIAEIEDAQSTKLMVDHLSSLMRYTISGIDSIVTLGAECEIVKSYLYIQQMRFGNRLCYEIDLSEPFLNIQVPSMLLQPLVENAIVHGIEPMEKGGKLHISAIDLDDYFAITVADNGCGMDRNTYLKMQMYSPEEEDLHDYRKGIGILNVRKRLQIVYGYDAMDIESIPGNGTSIRLYLKKKIGT